MEKLQSPLKYRAATYKTYESPLEITTEEADVFDDAREGQPLKDDSTMLIKVHAAALNPVDILLKAATPKVIFASRTKGFGRDYSGTVVRAGARVTAELGFRAGDSVMGMYRLPFGKGTVAEYVHVNPFKQTAVTKFDPAQLSYEKAAAWPLAGGTAYTCLFDYVKIDGWTPAGGSHPDRAILVLGGSTAVGRYIIQIAKNVLGVGRIVAVCSGASAEEVRSLGATHIVDYKAVKPGESYATAVKALGFKYDLITDCVGGREILSSAAAGTDIHDFLKPKSEGSAYVTLTGDAKLKYARMPPVLGAIVCKTRELSSRIGLLCYKYVVIMTEPSRAWAKAFGDWIAEGKVLVEIDSVHDMDKVQDAVDRLASNQARGKVVVRVE
ncbi:uncharacterized protein V1510DRAFT_414007 [Dipodascopsis tothii]|uniref:uncharacterized protein n=1 Tax=Dipodascopsis tothii TaxID=44089 RepID=UPI0034CFF96B